MKSNYWEKKNCGRTAGGVNVKEFGVCPAFSEKAYNGKNSGSNAGRYCWAVAGTFCNGKIQGSAAQKVATCLTCDFFKSVRAEEGINFLI